MTNLVGVYRVERADGVGPYFAEEDAEAPHALCRRHQDTDHPGPRAEGFDVWSGDGRAFGFESLKQLSRWFTRDELAELSRRGFEIKRFWVPADKVTRGRAQVVFRKPQKPAPSRTRYPTLSELLKGLQP